VLVVAGPILSDCPGLLTRCQVRQHTAHRQSTGSFQNLSSIHTQETRQIVYRVKTLGQMQNTAVLLLSTPMRLARKGSLAAILHSSSNTTAAFCTATTTWNSCRDLLLPKRH